MIKLFEIRIVASNFLGLSSSFTTSFCFLEFDIEASFKATLESEKNAISEPEINAEHINKTSKAKHFITNAVLIIAMEKNKKLEGSGSNYAII